MLEQSLPDKLRAVWQNNHFTQATLIQEKMWDEIMEDQSVIGISPTGTGKTLSYVLPLSTKIKEKEGTQVLVLVPSQELAMQVSEVWREWLKEYDVRVTTLIGQANIKRQIERLKEKPEIIVGTPGRVWELVQQKKIKAHLLKAVVLDEVDQLISHSELNAAKNVLQRIQHECQIVAVSATGNKVIEPVSALVRREMKVIDVTGEDTSQGTLEHVYIKTASRRKKDVLKHLAYFDQRHVLVFFTKVEDLGAVADKLTFDGVPNVTLASDQSKFEREGALRLFREQKVSLLLTTDLAARGLDLPGVTDVVHYDLPYNAESYLHRSGRTGRMGQDGRVIMLLSEHEERDYRRMMKEMEQVTAERFIHGGALHESLPKGPVSHKNNKDKKKKRTTRKKR